MAFASRLCDLARISPSLADWRRGALAILRSRVPFDGAFFHELSPRAPFDRGALIGIDPMALLASSASWDENAVVLGRLRDLALAQDGVAIDHEAFPIGSRARREWDRRVRKPLGLRSVMVAHLEVRHRITAVILLGRHRSLFRVEDRRSLAKTCSVLAVCDALQQALQDGNVRGPAAQLECVDQRLTPRQREIALQVALGHTNEEIGKALGISANTVRNLLVQIRARLGAANRAEIVRVAVLR